MTRPTEAYLWAESAAPGRVTNPTGSRSGGYGFEDPLPSDEFNYLMQSPGRWIDYLRKQADGFDSIAQALASAAAGEHFRTNPQTNTDFRGRLAGTLTGDQIVALDTDGRYMYAVRENGGSYAVQKIDIATWAVSATFTLTGTPSGAAPVRCISCDGAHLAVGWDNNFEVFRLSDGVRVISATGLLTEPLDCVVFGSHAAYVSTDTSGLGVGFVQAYSLSTYTGSGSEFITLASGAFNASITSDGRFIYVAYSDGSDTEIEVLDINVNTVLTTPVSISSTAPYPRGIACNGKYLAVALGPAGQRVYRYSYDGTNVTLALVATLTDISGQSLAFTEDWLMVASSGVNLIAYDLHGFTRVWQENTVTYVSTLVQICTDGVHIYIPSSNSSQRIAQMHTGKNISRWYRPTATDRYRAPYYNLAIPSP